MAAASRRANWRAGFRRSFDPAVVSNEELLVVGANRAACLLFRLPERKLVNHAMTEVTGCTKEQAAAMAARLRNQGWLAGELDVRMPDGGQLHLRFKTTAHIELGLHLTTLYPPVSDEFISDILAPVLLTTREREILTLIAAGETTHEIANGLGLSARTVETYLKRVVMKLGARNRAHAITLAMRAGEITL